MGREIKRKVNVENLTDDQLDLIGNKLVQLVTTKLDPVVDEINEILKIYGTKLEIRFNIIPKEGE